MNAFDLEKFLPYQLSVLAARVSKGLATIYSERFGITVAEWRVLAHLSQSGTVSVREIHQRVDLEKSKVSRAATRLEQRGLIAKAPNAADGRLIALSLTAPGRAIIAEIVPLARAYEQQVLEDLGQDRPSFRNAIEVLLRSSPQDTDPAA